MQKPPEKFDPVKHAGTIYDEKIGRRVPVKDEDQLPKPKNNAEIIMELQRSKIEKEKQAEKSKEEMLQD